MTEFNCLFKSKKGLELCNSIPTVEYKPEWDQDKTAYIDGVRPTDSVFTKTSIVKFVDSYHRSAISFKYQVHCSDTAESHKEYAATAFQRYTDSANPWMFGGKFAARDTATESRVNHTWLENLLTTGTETTKMCGIDPSSGNHLCTTCNLIFSGSTSTDTAA